MPITAVFKMVLEEVGVFGGEASPPPSTLNPASEILNTVEQKDDNSDYNITDLESMHSV